MHLVFCIALHCTAPGFILGVAQLLSCPLQLGHCAAKAACGRQPRILDRCVQEAHARRGAHWTFDAARFVECVRNVRGTGAASVPSFNHGAL